MNSFDLSVVYALNGLAGKNEWLDAAIIFGATWLGWWLVAGVAALIIVPLFRKKRFLAEQTKKVLAVFGSSVIARYGIVEAIRFFYDRARPFEVIPDVYLLIPHPPGGSFPSGHAAFFFALAAGIWFYHRRLGTLFFIAAALISLSRIAAGLHWPSDILGGAVVGILAAEFASKTIIKITASMAIRSGR